MALLWKQTAALGRKAAGAVRGALICVALPALSGCHSHYVQADVKNASGEPISLLEVDYPSASFGAESLAANADFGYRFKILGSGPTKVLWTDAHHREHSVAGPTLLEGEQGTLQITITAATGVADTNGAEDGTKVSSGSGSGGAIWTAHLRP